MHPALPAGRSLDARCDAILCPHNACLHLVFLVISSIYYFLFRYNRSLGLNGSDGGEREKQKAKHERTFHM